MRPPSARKPITLLTVDPFLRPNEPPAPLRLQVAGLGIIWAVAHIAVASAPRLREHYARTAHLWQLPGMLVFVARITMVAGLVMAGDFACCDGGGECRQLSLLLTHAYANYYGRLVFVFMVRCALPLCSFERFACRPMAAGGGPLVSGHPLLQTPALHRLFCHCGSGVICHLRSSLAGASRPPMF